MCHNVCSDVFLVPVSPSIALSTLLSCCCRGRYCRCLMLRLIGPQGFCRWCRFVWRSCVASGTLPPRFLVLCCSELSHWGGCHHQKVKKGTQSYSHGSGALVSLKHLLPLESFGNMMSLTFWKSDVTDVQRHGESCTSNAFDPRASPGWWPRTWLHGSPRSIFSNLHPNVNGLCQWFTQFKNKPKLKWNFKKKQGIIGCASATARQNLTFRTG